MADGHPDLNGVWEGGGDFFSNSVATIEDKSVRVLAPVRVHPDSADLFSELDKQAVERRAAAPNPPPYKPELMGKVKQLSDSQSKLDPAFYCRPEGVPRMGPPNQIIHTPDRVVFLYAAQNTFRVIPTDGRPHPTGTDPSYKGDSVGRWEVDTLVVDVRNFTAETWLGSDGYFHSEAMRVTERFRRDGDSLTYTATVEDPEVFTRPWAMSPRTLKLVTDPNAALEEDPPCIEKDGAHLVTDDHH
jgi:hypothetical protein